MFFFNRKREPRAKLNTALDNVREYMQRVDFAIGDTRAAGKIAGEAMALSADKDGKVLLKDEVLESGDEKEIDRTRELIRLMMQASIWRKLVNERADTAKHALAIAMQEAKNYADMMSSAGDTDAAIKALIEVNALKDEIEARYTTENLDEECKVCLKQNKREINICVLDESQTVERIISGKDNDAHSSFQEVYDALKMIFFMRYMKAHQANDDGTKEDIIVAYALLLKRVSEQSVEQVLYDISRLLQDPMAVTGFTVRQVNQVIKEAEHLKSNEALYTECLMNKAHFLSEGEDKTKLEEIADKIAVQLVDSLRFSVSATNTAIEVTKNIEGYTCNDANKILIAATGELLISEMCKKAAETLVTQAIEEMETEDSSAEIMALNMTLIKALGDGIKVIDIYLQQAKCFIGKVKSSF